MLSKKSLRSLLNLLAWTTASTLIACSSDAREWEEFPTGPPPTPFPGVIGTPSGWAGGEATTEFEAGRAIDVVHGGDTSGYLRARVPNPAPGRFGTFNQGIRAGSYKGKRVRWSGYVRTESVAGEGVGIFLRADGSDAQLAFDDMSGRLITGTHDWTYYEAVLDLPQETIGISFGVFLQGPGTAWFDDFKFEVVGTDVQVTASSVPIPYPNPGGIESLWARKPFVAVNLDFEGHAAPVATQATSDWLRMNSVPFLTDDARAPDDDLQPLRDIIGNVRIVGLGEGTHGTREFFRMKHRLFAFLVRNLAFNHFSLEAGLPEALSIDRYVQTGDGDPRYLVQQLGYWPWETEEVFDLVRWMHEWNAAGNQPRVHFTGFDMQYKDVAEDSVRAFADDVDAATGDSVRTAYACLPADPGATSIAVYSALPKETKDACRLQLQGVDSLFARNLTTWSATLGGARTTMARRLARVISQWEDYAATNDLRLRDKYMAENLAWWHDRLPAGGTAAWAHNGHLVKLPPQMGSYLATTFGTNYLNIAMTFSSGQFNAYTQTSTGTFTTLAVHTLNSSYPGSIEAIFDATGMPRAIFDARRISSGGTVSSVLTRHTTIRSIGAVFSPTADLGRWEGSVVLPEDYNVIIWFRTGSPTRLALGY
jgi:erythromycin esterase